MLRRPSPRVRLLIALAAIAWAIAAQPVFAADEAAESWHYAVWNTLMSPYCPGRTLLDCTSSEAADLREEIAADEAAGLSREEVEEKLLKRFGDKILQAPRASGFGLLAYVTPIVIVIIGAVGLAIFLRRQASAARETPAPAAAPPDPELDRLIDEEMQRR